MNEFNIDEEDPDEHWEGFKRFLILGLVLIVIGIISGLNYCKWEQ